MHTSSGLENVVVFLVFYLIRSNEVQFVLVVIVTLSLVFVLILVISTLEEDRGDHSLILEDT